MIEGPNTRHQRVNILMGVLIARATGGNWDDEAFQLVRAELVKDKTIKDLVPEFLRTCRSEDQFWQFIKYKFGTYAERREFLWSEFARLFDSLESSQQSPSDPLNSAAIEAFDSEHVQKTWQTALARRDSDPEGAITSARSLLEAVCKHILDEAGVGYPNGVNLPKLFSLVAEQLNLSPSQHSEQIFKQVLGGCVAVVEGLGAIRSRLGDAHGQGKRAVKPKPRHAGLAVNLSGSMATFLIQTWEAKSDRAA